MPSALITGAAGQDGFLLGQLLLQKGYEVYGLVRDTGSVEQAVPIGVTRLPGDLCDRDSLERTIRLTQPDEIYNLAGPTFKPATLHSPGGTIDVLGHGPLRLLEIIRAIQEDGKKRIRLFQASSSEMYGQPRETPQDERTPLDPLNPYAVGKTLAHHLVRMYRDTYGIYASTGICYNHESPRRRPEFVTRHISQGVAKIATGLERSLVLGDLTARRDWGAAEDFVEAMWMSLQAREADDYVLATGVQRSLEELCAVAFAAAGIPNWQRYVKVESKRTRRNDPQNLVGNPLKAERTLGWQRKISFEALIAQMVYHDIDEVTAGLQDSATQTNGGSA